MKKKNQKLHAHATKENESNQEKATDNEDPNEEYVLISSLTGTVSHGSENWLIESVASKNIACHKDSLSCLTHKDYPHKVHLGDDYQYPIKVMGKSYYKLKYENSMKMKEVLYVPILKKNLIFISTLHKKGRIVSLLWRTHMFLRSFKE